MSVTAAALRKLAMLNLSAEQMAGVLDILADGAEADEARRAGQRERTQKHRAKRDGNVTVTSPERDTVSPKKEISPTPPKEKTTPSSSEASASSLNPRGELETVLDAERAKAVIDHRQRIRKPLTAYAARQLATKLAQCPDPNAAADEMISNGWQGFKPEWLESRSSNRATAPPRQTGVAAAAQRIIESEANGSERIFGSNGDAKLVSPAGGSGSRNAPSDLPGGIGRQFVTINH